jgi:hypothetical protein
MAHLVEENFAIILMRHGNELLKILRLNIFYEYILGFNHCIPNLKSRPEQLKCLLPVQPCCRVGRV